VQVRVELTILLGSMADFQAAWNNLNSNCTIKTKGGALNAAFHAFARIKVSLFISKR